MPPKTQNFPRYKLENYDIPSTHQINNVIRLPKTLTSIYLKELNSGCLPLENAFTLEFDPLNNIQILDMHKMELLCKTGRNDTEGGLSGLFQLRYLDLSATGLTYAPRILNAINLEIFNISNNRLGHEGWSLQQEFFWNSSKLIELDISNNELTKLPQNLLDQWPVIEILRLANNRLTTLSFLSHGPGEFLILVDLSRNSLSKLEEAEIKTMKQFERNSFTINLKNNPFLCVCALKETAIWLISTKVNVQDKDQYICNNDPRAKVTGLDIHNLCPSSLIFVALTVALTAFVCIFVSIVSFRYRMRIKITIYLFKWTIKKMFINVSTNEAFDTYVIYNDNCQSDRQYVVRELLTLVEEELGKTLFIWDRDSIPGGARAETIVERMASCQKILIIHSAGLFTCDNISYENDKCDELSGSEIPPCVPLNNQNQQRRGEHNEWMDFTLLTAMRFIKDKPICVIKRDQLSPKSVSSKWLPLLFPNVYISPITIIRAQSQHFSTKLQHFLIN